ncbi:DUF485 domain-containing protein, partial [Pseudomonas aeruginosa]|uniref:DUF485 domain-containing protein n=1 Tax=Pseudomonas aeruginosa TaxID=287 RepID=UPI00301506A3
MNGTIYQRIEDNAHFRELVEKRQRFATILSIIMLAVYIGFILSRRPSCLRKTRWNLNSLG